MAMRLPLEVELAARFITRRTVVFIVLRCRTMRRGLLPQPTSGWAGPAGVLRLPLGRF